MNDDSRSQLTRWLLEACLVEVLSDKPGNVGPRAEFSDASVDDFIESARVSASLLAEAQTTGVGRAVFEAVQATRHAVGHNTNLGILLLLAPLAAVPLSESLDNGIERVLSELTVEDAEWAYEAIRLAAPGGLGKAESQDVSETPEETLRQCMVRAAKWDRIAAQYANGFEDVLGTGVVWLDASSGAVEEDQRIAWLSLRLMARFGDSLIGRKCGPVESQSVRRRADTVLGLSWPQQAEGRQAYRLFDEYLRSDGNRLNPGTTADLVAAIVFAGLRSGTYTVSAALRRQMDDRGLPA